MLLATKHYKKGKMILHYGITGFPDSSGQAVHYEFNNQGIPKPYSADYEGIPSIRSRLMMFLKSLITNPLSIQQFQILNLGINGLLIIE